MAAAFSRESLTKHGQGACDQEMNERPATRGQMVIAVICNDLFDGQLSAMNSHWDLAAQGLVKAECCRSGSEVE